LTARTYDDSSTSCGSVCSGVFSFVLIYRPSR
jgi:hypothetical protein